MAPKRKRKLVDKEQASDCEKKSVKVDPEKIICQKTLRTIEQREAMTTDDRLTLDEKKQLLEAYNQCGFSVFQDMQLLQRFIPSRTENDLKGLIGRLKTGMESGETPCDDPLQTWQRLCLNLMGVYSRQKQTNIDDVLSDALKRTAEELEVDDLSKCNDSDKPNYPQLLRNFSQLVAGRFPDNMSPANSRISMKLFNHINEIADSINTDQLQGELGEGAWLAEAIEKRRARQEIALRGLDEAEKVMKAGPSVRDLEKNRAIDALCMELPKIKRITELMNPLMVNESVASVLLDALSRD